jgi:hypothetical protein
VILDSSDQAGDLGYHDLTDEGLPQGKVFAKTDMADGSQWSVTCSHELLEMLVDPDINLTATVQPDVNHMILYSYEVCDPCEYDPYGYKIDNVLVSDFVHPAWFQTFSNGSAQFDHMKHITAPLQLLPGGYIQTYNVTQGFGWQQQSLKADALPRYSMRAPIGSRRERRRLPRDQWLRTKPK